MARTKHGKPSQKNSGGGGGRNKPHKRNFSGSVSTVSNAATTIASDSTSAFSLRATAVNTGRRDNLVRSNVQLRYKRVAFVKASDTALPPPPIQSEPTSRTEACSSKSDNAPSEDVPSEALASMNLRAELTGTTDLAKAEEKPKSVTKSDIRKIPGLDTDTARLGFISEEFRPGAKPGLGSSTPGLRCSSPTPSNSSEEVIVFTGRNPVKASSTELPPQNSAVSNRSPALLEEDHAGDGKGAAADISHARYSTPQVTLPGWNDVGVNWVHTEEKRGRGSMKARKRQNRGPQNLDPDAMEDYISNVAEHRKDDLSQQRQFTGARPLSLDDGLGNFAFDANRRPRLGWDQKNENGSGEEEDDTDEIDDEDDAGPQDDNDGDDDDDLGRLLDEEDLLERRKARMTDEQIARILTKQEELGMGSTDIVLFDGLDDDDGDEFEEYVYRHGPGSGNGLHARMKRNGKGKKSGKEGQLMEQQLYGLDPDLREAMLGAWDADRQNKRLKKAERQELRELGLLGKKKDKVELAVKYPQGISKQQIMDEIRTFLSSPHECLPFPPMEKDERRQLHQAATAFKLKSKSIGNGASRYTVVVKTSRTVANDDDTAFARADRRYDRQLFQGIGKDKAKKDRSKKSNAISRATYTEGDIVGSSAPELDANNRGRAMMEKMGWSHGMALGLKNEGILHPIVHRVKNSKAGLG
ncbi:MAG: hypothetical protein Q9165_007353 [Trypethelium subeluteriae]